MIDPVYCQTMARYNRWQNNQLADYLLALTEEELDRPRGAFFTSIRRTANHLLWADGTWMSRFDGGDRPMGGISESVTIQPDIQGWAVARSMMDDRIEDWCEDIDQDRLDGDLSWFSGALGADVTKPLGLCVVHLFNHQTHHRGQIHAMLTATGSKAPVTDLFILPD
ncbi:DinB family protein [Chachezhania sediminis]|uniref:DinB family protein n=1 Tax=Chachezhania sediminis TaxID=2599291 RepID=UPI00131E44F4|nr:DinB family protein [Chachezhania sediminis]